jgi:hypothetical protein
MIAYSAKTEYNIAPVAQWIAQWISNPLVVGSSPTGGAKRKEESCFYLEVSGYDGL